MNFSLLTPVQAALSNQQCLRLPEPYFSCFTSIFGAVESLRSSHDGHEPKLTFSPGDRLVGDTGEALAKLIFNLIPLRDGETKGHDYWSPDLNKKVQVKTTAKEKLSLLGRKNTSFEHIIAFKLYNEGSFELLFNGPGFLLLDAVSRQSIAISTVRAMNTISDCTLRVPFRSILPEFSHVI